MIIPKNSTSHLERGLMIIFQEIWRFLLGSGTTELGLGFGLNTFLESLFSLIRVNYSLRRRESPVISEFIG